MFLSQEPLEREREGGREGGEEGERKGGEGVGRRGEEGGWEDKIRAFYT